MKAINRILQILAALGAVAAGVFFFLNENRQQLAASEFESINSQLSQERSKTKRLEEEVAALGAAREKDEAELKTLASENALANSQLLQLRRENQRLLGERETQEAAERQLQAENGRLSKALSELRATSVSREQVAQLERTISKMERENLELKQTQPSLAPQSSSFPATIPENPTLKGYVLTVGKGASFVVLDIGYNDGVRLENELVIQHADTPIAKIQVTEVKENLSIARVLPDSLIKTPQSGDSVASLN